MNKCLLIIIIAILELPASFTMAQSNYALNLNGTTDYVTIGAPLVSNGSYTKEAWLYQTSSTGSQNVISSLNAPFWINGGILSAGQGGSFSLVTDVSTFPLNTWVYVAVTYDAPSTTMNLYKNGSLIASNASVSVYTAENTFIGSHQGSTSFFSGYIDEVRLWTTALTQAQLKAHLFSGPADNAAGLVSYYKCDDGSGTTLTSSCTNTSGDNGTLQGTATWVASPIQYGANALSFNGSGAVVTIPESSSFDITSAITLEAWVYATKNSGVQDVVSKSSQSTNTGYIFPRTDDGWAHTVLYLNVSGGWHTLSAVYPSLNAWHHLAATYDGATMKVYVDGVLTASQAQTGTIATNSNALVLGNQAGYGEYFGGTLDEVRVWNVARTQAQIQAGMGAELNPVGQTGLVSDYGFDQGLAAGNNAGLTTVIDQSNTNNGALSGFTLTGSTNNFVVQNPVIIVLPLTLVSFTAKKASGSVLLQWSTASEDNTGEFVVQRSTGNGWDELATVPAAGAGNMLRQYSYTDTRPANGIDDYRLLEKDADGKETYSPILSVPFNSDIAAFIVYNNPVVDGVLQVSVNKACHLALYDSEGRLVWQKVVAAGAQSIDVSVCAGGIYFLKGNGQTKEVLVR